MRKKFVVGATGALAAIAPALGASAPAYAGDWAWGNKNCVPSGKYVHTKGSGSGDITHSHRAYEATSSSIWVAHHGSLNATTSKTFWFGFTTAASVAGAHATSASYYCQ